MNPREESVPFWRDTAKRNFCIQALVLIGVIAVAYIMIGNMAAALKRQGIASGFGFLAQEAAFAIDDALISYTAEDTFGKALFVGFLNTFMVAVLGNILAVFWGSCIGVGLLSQNWLLRNVSRVYVDVIRNIPLLLQLFLWYAFMTEVFPPVRQAIEIVPRVFFSQRGMVFPSPLPHPIYKAMAAAFLLGGFVLVAFYRHGKNYRRETGKNIPYLKFIFFTPIILPLVIWAFGGFPWKFSYPELQGFNFQGGMTLTPEFFSLLLGLVFYTSAFVAEIVRSGIQSVPKGQWEAASSLGLSRFRSLTLVVFPQALRVMIPPLTSQMLNLTKNSSLAVAIGYPDLVSVANTTTNQTGQAVECIILIMVIYLFFSLAISLLMNWYNHVTRLVER